MMERNPETRGDSQQIRLYCVICTYHRNRQLEATIDAVLRQTRRPDHLIVVDNGSSSTVRDIVESRRATYVDAHENLGPGGGFSLGMRHALTTASADDWVVTVGDDGPPQTDDRFERLLAFGQKMAGLDQWLAAVGRNGARYVYELGVFARIPQRQIHGFVSVDYLAGSQFHRVAALRELGVYREDFFFGFEEAEYGLRAKRNGWTLYAHGDEWRRDRERSGKRSNSGRRRTPPGTASWRRYYSARNATFLAGEYGSARWVKVLVALRSIGAAAALLRRLAPLGEVVWPIRGALDGLRGRLGRTIDPPSASEIQ